MTNTEVERRVVFWCKQCLTAELTNTEEHPTCPKCDVPRREIGWIDRPNERNP